jgi:ribonuclease J
MADEAFDLVSRYGSSRIYRNEIEANPRRWVLLFRESMTADIVPLGDLAATSLIYSLWPGYLDRPDNRLRNWCTEHEIELKLFHTSGHADPQTLVRYASALKPRVIIPIHTDVPHVFGKLIPNSLVLNDGAWLGL